MKYPFGLGSPMAGGTPWEERFARQLTLQTIGEEGQRRLREATAVVVGAGALGSGSAELLGLVLLGSCYGRLHRRSKLSEAMRLSHAQPGNDLVRVLLCHRAHERISFAREQPADRVNSGRL